MATRKGATKTDAQGRRFRYNGRKWVQIKATGNGRNTTSARNRAARQSRSNATVTESGQGRPGSAKVTGSRSNTQPQLPSRTSGSSARRRAERAVRSGLRRDRIARQNLETVSRGVNRMVRQRSAADKLEEAAKGTKGQGTRTAGAGGTLGKRTETSPTNQRGSRARTNTRGQRALPPASQTAVGSGTNQRISGTRTQGQGGNPRRTGAKVTSSDNQQQRRSSTQRRGGQGGGTRRLNGGGQRPQLPAGRNSSRGNDSGNRFRAANERNRTGTGGRSTVGRGGRGTPGLGAPTSLGGKLLGGASLLIQAADTIQDLSSSIGRGEGYGAIPGLLQRVTQGPNTRAQNGGFYGPGGNPNGSGQGQAQQTSAPTAPQLPQAPVAASNVQSGGNVPAPIPAPVPAASGGVSGTPQPNPNARFEGMTAEQKMQAWAELFPILAARLANKPNQSGYDAIFPQGPPAPTPIPGDGIPRL